MKRSFYNRSVSTKYFSQLATIGYSVSSGTLASAAFLFIKIRSYKRELKFDLGGGKIDNISLEDYCLFLPEAIIFVLTQKRYKKVKASFDLYPPFS
ncbi:hypothetical protein [uncultured Draconibacterium sp.]|uniref:hypothetical protein n=1 Tax=uncultured Draconibacterium sp. TaxID=1573823 RepID=UPI0025E7F332|nr:hypothetical protein [uncultured Draconibacterium sp.]